MRKVTFFLLLFFALSWTLKVQAQTFTTSLDSLVATFEVKNKKAMQVQPNTATAKASAQKNADDLLFILDSYFTTEHYRKGKAIQIAQYQVSAHLLEEGTATDSFLSVIYILEIPELEHYFKGSAGDVFEKVKSRPTKAPEQFYINALDAQRLILVSVFSPLYRDEVMAKRRQEHIYTYLDWIRQKYR